MENLSASNSCKQIKLQRKRYRNALRNNVSSNNRVVGERKNEHGSNWSVKKQMEILLREEQTVGAERQKLSRDYDNSEIGIVKEDGSSSSTSAKGKS